MILWAICHWNKPSTMLPEKNHLLCYWPTINNAIWKICPKLQVPTYHFSEINILLNKKNQICAQSLTPISRILVLLTDFNVGLEQSENKHSAFKKLCWFIYWCFQFINMSRIQTQAVAKGLQLPVSTAAEGWPLSAAGLPALSRVLCSASTRQHRLLAAWQCYTTCLLHCSLTWWCQWHIIGQGVQVCQLLCLGHSQVATLGQGWQGRWGALTSALGQASQEKISAQCPSAPRSRPRITIPS